MPIFIIMGVLTIIGVIIYFVMQANETFDIGKDYKNIKIALKKYTKQNNGLSKGLENIKHLLPKDSNVNISNYTISMDDNFLLVKKIPRGVVPQEVVKKIGGKSTYRNKQLRLAFYTSDIAVAPEAIITISPINNVTTTTKMDYSHEKSKVIEGIIVKAEWENNQEFFDAEGLHKVKLRVMDKNLKWSEWETEEILVREEKGLSQLIGAGGHIFVLSKNGDLSVYGENTYGQLGNKSTTDSQSIEKNIHISKIDTLAASETHTLFLKADKKVYSVGNNSHGQLGIGDRKEYVETQLVWGMDNIIKVGCGNEFSVALTSSGDVYTWGHNENQSLGIGKKHFMDRPIKVDAVSNIKDISVGYDYVLALSHDGTVKSWGGNKYGQLGLGYKSKSNEPTLSLLKGIKAIAAGKNSSFAVTSNDRILGFGLNKNSQLGFDGEKEVLFPTEIPELREVKKVVCGNDFVIVLDLMGNVYSWGMFTPVNLKYSTTPLKSETYKYIKDIATTASKGYVLTKDDTIFEFGTSFENSNQLPFAKQKEVKESKDED